MDTPTLTIFKQDPAPKNAFISLNSNHKYPLELTTTLSNQYLFWHLHKYDYVIFVPIHGEIV